MDISQLEAFIAVYQSLNFTKAAEFLHISQSAVTARIKALEITIGKTLFMRDNRNVSLTQAGMAFLPYAERMLRLFEESKLTVSEQFENYIVISGPGAVWHYRYLDDILAFRRNHPDTALKIFSYIDSSYMVRDLLLDGTVHIAVRYDPPDHPKVSKMLLFEDEFVLVSAQKNLRVSRLDFFSQRYIHVGFSFPEWFSEMVGPGYIPTMQIDHSGIIMTLIMRGEAFGFLTKSAARSFLDEQKLFLVECDFPMPEINKIQAYASFLTEKHDNPSVQLGLELLGVK
ncbi:LysR family transcriptional regulator [Paenibacillus sp. BC26]|uniref:LysR family transcriptional regulator n=1 Tax=Paenibacillus sp. BC26 TaxID=1881032 RepID=UPI0008EEF1C4|nr:LysR family transcriptional regulator [Paenibacillus sp. BC26]SFS68587.1 LysR family transcriptional regulator, repressor for citA [Paenibacillus sp. BC26]